MCWPLIIAGVGAVAGVAGTVMAGNAASNAAASQNAYNAETKRLQDQYRLDLMDYNNTNYALDVDFYKRQIDWEKGEFEKTKAHVAATITAVNEDMFGKLATQMTRIVEQDLAATLQIGDTNRQVRQETGVIDAQVADRGIGGNTVNMLRGEVARQGGEAKNVIGLNADSARHQAVLEMSGIKSARDGALSSITIPTFQPLAAPRAPAPISPVNPSQTVSGPSAGSIVMGGISSGINLGLSGYNFGKAIS
ncbi:hypothetical protein UFOVP823_28 [uncultured Caudovirales phage]|uniref:Uncharacterized protein n=1 Tax=uncultured Caudovirales phage TaxID=2100421 RepID=A0A6J5P1X0_9CAUD|nr:hypothetical protein UFOVP823_28 [uncultured Caudovirales phage]